MKLEDLTNLLWSALEIGKGSSTLFNELEKCMSKQIYKIKDEEFQTLISCVTNDKSKPEFTEKFLDVVLTVIREKKTTF